MCTKVVNDAEIWKQKYNSVLADLARVTAERDALLKYAPRECNTCKYWHRQEGTSWCDAPGEDPCHVGARELWQWRGPQKEE